MKPRRREKGAGRDTYSALNSRNAIEQGTRLLLRGKHARAREILSEAAALDAENGALQARFGDALYQGERVAETRAAHRRAITLDDGEFQAWGRAPNARAAK